jgi:DNA excision repair protein ERCC-1
MMEVGKNYKLRVLLVLIDEENIPVLQELNKLAFSGQYTLLCAWSNMECARYLETFKSYEGKSSASIQEKEETEFMPRYTKILTAVRSVNKTDATTLLDVFGSFGNLCTASEQDLLLCPGIGEKKVKRLYQTLHQPFLPQEKRGKVNVVDAYAVLAAAASEVGGSPAGEINDDAQVSTVLDDVYTVVRN